VNPRLREAAGTLWAIAGQRIVERKNHRKDNNYLIIRELAFL